MNTARTTGNLNTAVLGASSRKPGIYSAPAKRGRIQVAPKEDRTIDGVTFDSKSEMKRWLQLKLLERAGEISGLERQREFPLAFEGRPVKIRSGRYPSGRVCKYTADFAYLDKAGRLCIEEHKGVDNEADRLRRAVFEAIYQINVIVSGAAVMRKKRA